MVQYDTVRYGTVQYGRSPQGWLDKLVCAVVNGSKKNQRPKVRCGTVLYGIETIAKQNSRTIEAPDAPPKPLIPEGLRYPSPPALNFMEHEARNSLTTEGPDALPKPPASWGASLPQTPRPKNHGT